MLKLNQVAIARLAVIVAATGLAACGERTDSARMEQQGTAPTAQGERAADPAGRSVLETTQPAMVTAAVKAALANDAQTQAVKADVEVSGGGKVVLKGSAPDSAARDRAGQVVASIRGVTSVDNQLSVSGS